MKPVNKTLLSGASLAASFTLGLWFGHGKTSVAPAAPGPVIAQPAPRQVQPATPVAVTLPAVSRTDLANLYALVATDPRTALDEAMKLPDTTRLATMQNLLAVWLRNDRLAAAEWMTQKRGLREFEPLSAQVSDAFFPDDTEMSAMFSFDLTDEKLRDVRVNKIVAYWKSGAHLKFDNSPWEVDGPGTGQAKPAAATVVPPEAATKEVAATTETEPQS